MEYRKQDNENNITSDNINANNIDASSATTLTIGASVATAVTIGAADITTTIKGDVVSIGETVSETTVNDNLTVTGTITTLGEIKCGASSFLRIDSNGAEATMNINIGNDDTGNDNAGINNLMIGYNVGNALDSLSQNNIGIGNGSLAGSFNDGDFNTCVGTQSGNVITTGDSNVILGHGSGLVTTGSSNIILGTAANVAPTLDNQIVIGSSAVSDKANQIMLGDSSIIEIVPNASASCDIGTATNPFDNINIKGTIIGMPSTSSGAGAIAITDLSHQITSTATGNAMTLANGSNGQILNILYVAEAAGADTAILTPTTLAGGATITFNTLGDSCQLTYSTTGGWHITGIFNAVVA